MYHRFSPEENHPRHLGARPFRLQLEYLTTHHEIWSPDQQLDAVLAQEVDTNRPPVVVTIDDGYQDFYDIAFPILQEYGVTATVFVTTGFIAGHTWFWWDRLAWLLDNASPGKRDWRLGETILTGDASCSEERDFLWNAIADHLRFLPFKNTNATLEELSHELGLNLPTSPPEQYAAMSWEQVRNVSAVDMTIGAHTVTHPILSRVDGKQARDEISDSRHELFEALGQPVNWFCYPQGGPADFNADTVAAVREAGFRGCYTAFQNPTHTGEEMTLPRYSISGNFDHFRWVLCGAEFLFMRLKVLFGGNALPGKSYWAGHHHKKDGAVTS